MAAPAKYTSGTSLLGEQMAGLSAEGFFILSPSKAPPTSRPWQC